MSITDNEKNAMVVWNIFILFLILFRDKVKHLRKITLIIHVESKIKVRKVKKCFFLHFERISFIHFSTNREERMSFNIFILSLILFRDKIKHSGKMTLIIRVESKIKFRKVQKCFFLHFGRIKVLLMHFTTNREERMSFKLVKTF